jgi:hypothetical protein
MEIFALIWLMGGCAMSAAEALLLEAVTTFVPTNASKRAARL